MICSSFKLIDDVIDIPKWLVALMATSWQIVLVIIYLIISMMWNNNIIHKKSKYHLYYGILHANALFMSLGVTGIFWSGYVAARLFNVIEARSLNVPILYLHLQHTLPFGIMIFDLFCFKDYNDEFHKQSYIKYLMNIF